MSFTCSTLRLLSFRKQLSLLERGGLGFAEGLRALRNSSASRVRLVHFLILVLLITMVTMLLPAVAMHQIEAGWTYLDAIYFCFISLATIGFGDLIPDEDTWDESQSNTPLQELYHFVIIREYILSQPLLTPGVKFITSVI